ncbi:unnamed protein product [Albugo candida]|uniref:Uncharacterized protein n=1 Tax=Albugo candida TaxID=65357 RepID=A0A024GMN4_9STRA|nr:unnamed protein product [Albugo candida]|eukprot:CCI47964.1 unnamed protein product [Albugo candida]
MVRNSLLFVIVIEIMVIHTEAREVLLMRSLSSYSRLLAVTARNIKACHSCLIDKVGVERIHLVAINEDTLLYLIKSRNSITESFLFQCNNSGRFCQLQTQVEKFPPYSLILWHNPVLEFAISIFSTHMDDTIPDTSPNKNVGKELSNLQSYRKIPSFLFFDDTQTMYHRRNNIAKTGNDQMEWNQIGNPTVLHEQLVSAAKDSIAPRPARQYSRPVERCFYSCSRTIKCERCLALHSISLGVRAYSFTTVKRGFEFVFAFPSFYTPSRIQNNCAEKYCISLNSLSSTTCNNLDRIFPQDKKTLRHLGNLANRVENKIAMAKPDQFQGFVSSQEDLYFRHLLSEPDTGVDSEIKPSNFAKHVKLREEIQAIEEFLDQTKITCLRIETDQKFRLRFMHCLIKSVGDKTKVILIRSTSLTQQVIFLESTLVTADFGKYCKEDYSGSSITAANDPHSFCEYYRTKYKINVYLYPELSTLAKAKPQREPCILVSHQTACQKRCGECVKTCLNAIHKGWKSIQLTYSSLFWGPIEQNTWTMVDTVLLQCVKQSFCSRIQLLPAMVCKKHEEITRLHTNWQRDTDCLANCTVRNARAMSKFDTETDKVWPSDDHAFSGPASFLDRTAFMVAYNANIPKECVRCLIIRTEVFFFYESEGERFGYVWMRPTFADLLKPCVSKSSCTELWFAENFEHLAISDYMRPWSVLDIGDKKHSIT